MDARHTCNGGMDFLRQRGRGAWCVTRSAHRQANTLYWALCPRRWVCLSVNEDKWSWSKKSAVNCHHPSVAPSTIQSILGRFFCAMLPSHSLHFPARPIRFDFCQKYKKGLTVKTFSPISLRFKLIISHNTTLTNLRTMSTFNHSDYFVTGPNHVLCEVKQHSQTTNTSRPHLHITHD